MLKHISLMAIFVLSGCAALRQPGSIENAQARPVCLASFNIDHTDIPNDSTILFYMRDHTLWKNTLTTPCFGLKMDSRGFTYSPTDPGSDTICSNFVTIRTNTDHNICQLGTFTKISPPSHKS